MVLVFSI